MSRSMILIGLCAAAFTAQAAAAATLPVKSGAYIRDGFQCRGAPFAALIAFDGKNISGAHESDCSTTVVGRAAHHHYALRTTCRAAGDGAPTATVSQNQSLVVLSPSRIIFAHPTGEGRIDRAAYRLCPGAGPA